MLAGLEVRGEGRLHRDELIPLSQYTHIYIYIYVYIGIPFRATDITIKCRIASRAVDRNRAAEPTPENYVSYMYICA